MLTLSVRVRLWRERHKLYLSSVEQDVGCSRILFIEKGVWIIFEPRRSYQPLWLPLGLSGDNSVLLIHGWTAKGPRQSLPIKRQAIIVGRKVGCLADTSYR